MKKEKLPSRYQIIDKVHKWGVDIKDPLAVRELSEGDASEDEIIMTSKTDKSKNDIAIKQIEKRFSHVKNVKVGMNKGPEYPGVVATKVIDFIPYQQLLPNKMVLVSCDDVIEDELPNKKPENNDFMLFHFTDQTDSTKKFALYKFNDCEALPDEIQDSILGKRPNGHSLEEL